MAAAKEGKEEKRSTEQAPLSPRDASEEERRMEQQPLSAEDAMWLSSLSQPELDFLISLKELAITRAKNAGHQDIAEKFDLRMLRGLGITLLEHFKERAKSIPTMNSDLIDKLPLLRSDIPLSDNNNHNNLEIQIPNFATPNRKRTYVGEEGARSSKKQKTRDEGAKSSKKQTISDEDGAKSSKKQKTRERKDKVAS